MPPLLITQKDGELRFEVRAKPKAKKSALGDVVDGAIEIRVAAPPVDGAANDALCTYLAKLVGVAKRDVRVVRGESARHKLIAIAGIDEDALARALNFTLARG